MLRNSAAPTWTLTDQLCVILNKTVSLARPLLHLYDKGLVITQEI